MATTDRKHGGFAHHRDARADGVLTQAEGVPLRLARGKPPVLKLLRAGSSLELVGSDHVHGNINPAIEAQLADGETTGTPRGGDAAGAAS